MTAEAFQRKVIRFLNENGKGARERLALGSGVSTRTIDEIRRKGHVPRLENIIAVLRAMKEPIPASLLDGRPTATEQPPASITKCPNASKQK